jgi:hypothetical protein
MKEKRKTRLDKASASGPTEFIGFAAFATPDTDTDTTAASASAAPAAGTGTDSTKNALAWTPVYTGPDASLTVLFPRIGQKRDSNTKVKALQDLRDYFGTAQQKRLQVEALQHWAWLYHHKIHYDPAASVRAAAMQVWWQVAQHIPKAFETLTNCYSELLGMMYSCQTDPATEVRIAATTATAPTTDPLLWNSETANLTVWRSGIDAYVSRILSYSRASVMHEALVARKNEKAADLNEQQKDVMEERFERITGTALEAMGLWLRSNNTETSSSSGDETTTSDLYPNSKQWWKTLHSPKTSLRRKTYQLLATVCTRLPSHVPTDMHNALAQVLSSEKEAVNIPVLLETLLCFLAWSASHNSESDAHGVHDLLTKPLGKILKKACYGAKVHLWGPMLLPLTALFSNPVPLLKYMWEGRELTLGATDKWALFSGLAECASFCLLRRNNKDKDNVDSNTTAITNAQAIAQLWLQVLEVACQQSPTQTGAAKVAYTKLREELAKNLVDFRAATGQRPNCAFYSVTDWFWEKETGGLTTAIQQSNASALARLLQTMLERQQQQQPSLEISETPSPWIPLLQERFGNSLVPIQESSGAVPLSETYELFQAIFNFCGPTEVLPDGLLEKFVMNDVLRWIVIHTSILSTQKQSEKLAEQDFRLLSSCLADIEVKRPALWESLLREVVAAKCNLEMLVAGLKTLLKHNPTVDWIQCATLDQFVAQVGQQSIDHTSLPVVEPNEDIADGQGSVEVEVDDKYDHILELLRTCLGLSCDSSSMIISRDVLQSLIQNTRSSDNHKQALFEDTLPTPVLEVLLLLIQEGRPMMEAEEVDHVLLESWRQGGRLYEQYGAKCISGDGVVRTRFVAQSSSQLQQQLVDLCSVAEGTVASGGAVRWSDRAYRLLEICKPLSGNEGFDVPSPSFALLGLDDSSIWRSHPEVLFRCSAPFLRRFDNSADRLSILQGREEHSDLAVAVLLSLSEASHDAVAASKARTHRDLSAQFISLLGGKALDASLVESWVRSIVGKTSSALKTVDGRADERAIRKGIAVLSQLFDVMFLPLLPSGVTATITASDITEGDQLWYITEPKNPAMRELVQVVKIHVDAQTGNYFSIRVGRDGETQERQTVLERLRVEQSDDADRGGVSLDSISKEEEAKRQAMRTLILKELIKPSFMTAPWTSSLPELVNMVVGHIGLGTERGLGTAHYELFRLVSSIEASLRDSLSNGDTKGGANSLWTLALAFGFGLNTPPTRWVFKEVRVDPEPSYRIILDFYGPWQAGVDPGLDYAVLAWLAISMDAARSTDKDNEDRKSVIIRARALLFTLASHVLQSGADDSKFTQESMIATRAIYEGMRVVPLVSEGDDMADKLRKSQSDAMFRLVKSFASAWEDTGTVVGALQIEEQPAWRLFSSLPDIFELSRGRPLIRELLVKACGSSNVNYVSDALFVDSKRYFALQMLDALASSGYPLYSDVDEGVLSEETALRLKTWSHGLGAEEAEELEEDFELVSQWLPSRMMNEIETWHEETFHELDESVLIGRMLTWLSVLRFVDAAAPLDFRNRPAFVSYLGKCEAVDYVLNVSLLFDKTINDRKGKSIPFLLETDDPLQDESSLELDQLASLVLFRTIQVLPSLSRRWWEEDCPKVYTNSVQSFVEKHVAPKILQTELARIKTATTTGQTFGEMSVTGSLVSREVTATYEQDDFTLTVLISLPACFPFRSAQVDCSKTLGVSQSRWKRWSLQITLMLNSQGGTLQDALMLWKDNVDKEFEGIEPCPVCYSVLHVKTHKLPALECKTCHNRFHVDCLTQWFKSSGKSQCVLCQQPWQGSRIQ